MEINRPSQLYDQIVSTMDGMVSGNLIVEGYEESGEPCIKGPTLLIEFEMGKPGVRGGDGRYCHGYHVSIHCIVPNSIKRPGLAALNLSADIERIVDFNRWGIDSIQIDRPLHIRSEPSLFQKGSGGFEGWAVSWLQNIYLGESCLDSEEERGGISFSIDPGDADNIDSYSLIGGSDA